MANGSNDEIYRRLREEDFVLRPDRFATMSRDEYNWIRYPRSGATTIGWVCFGIAVGFLISILGRWLEWLSIPERLAGTKPDVEPWVVWELIAALVLASVFWILGRNTSRRTRQAFAKFEAIFYPDDERWGFMNWLKNTFKISNKP